jgi:hypothetical protein
MWEYMFIELDRIYRIAKISFFAFPDEKQKAASLFEGSCYPLTE